MSTQQQTKTRKRKPSKNWYFTADTDLSIIAYNESVDQDEKNKIYSREIRPAFEKLVENIIHTFKFYYTDGQSLTDVQHDVVSFLIEKLPKFTSGKGKAYSYFSIVAKNYLILNNNKNYKKLVDSSNMQDASDESIADVVGDEAYNTHISDFVDEFVKYFDANLTTCFPKRNDQLIVSAIVELFRKRDNLEIFNKKALYIYVREMTDSSTQQITKVVKMIKDKYKDMYQDYDRLGFIPVTKVY